ncbi:hypothetical protein SAMN05444487_11043 [Marininema mesophilum]|uniref:Uncharacterized protein n=1 Tax=Marininema mesophilum TaxID=1048340 RepID=A0A1H2YXN5_9BACL|nr:hypothetical protein [Marininema mesophilum]SDX09841.1 hypothetical protein SAMN05444487_11043 [Marininema mesophilum]
MTLSEAEKETVIQFDQTGDEALIYTASWDIARSLKRAGYTPVKKAEGAWWFQIPIGALRIEGKKQTLQLA